jgi:hypothetical protein
MEKLNCSYAAWKTGVQEKGFKIYHEPDTAKGCGFVWSGDANYLYATRIRGADFTDWSSNFSDISTEVTCEADAMILILSYGSQRRNFTPTLLPEGYNLYLMGRGDDPDATPPEIVIGGGDLFIASRSTEGEVTVPFQVSDKVYIIGGHCHYAGAVLGEHATFDIVAEASPVTPNESDEGNCILAAAALFSFWDSETTYEVGDLVTHATSGVNYYCHAGNTGQEPPNASYWTHMFNLIIPAAGDGDFDVDLDAAVLIPSGTRSGFWDWDSPDSGRGTITPSPTPQQARYYLFDWGKVLNKFARDIPLLGDDHVPMNLQNLKPALCLPHWTYQCAFHHVGGDAHTLEGAWFLFTGRKYTVD